MCVCVCVCVFIINTHFNENWDKRNFEKHYFLTGFFDDEQDGLPAGVFVVLEALHTVVLVLVGTVDSVRIVEHCRTIGGELSGLKCH